jgi:hypothetical protein
MPIEFNIKEYVDVNSLDLFREHVPDWNEAIRCPMSEPAVLYFNTGVSDDTALCSTFREEINSLEEMYRLYEQGKGKSPKSQKSLERKIRQIVHPEHIGQFKEVYMRHPDGWEISAAEVMNLGELDSDLESYVNSFFLHLPIDSVRLTCDQGYFIPFGWTPSMQMLYFSGPDFYETGETPEDFNGYIETPKPPPDRGIPLDVAGSNSNCGPSALAAYLNISCKQAIELAPIYREKGYISPNPMRDAFKNNSTPHTLKPISRRPKSLIKTMEKHGSKGLALIKFYHMKPETGFIANVNTHWVAIDGDRIYDVNGIQPTGLQGTWMNEKQWKRNILPKVFAAFEGTSDYFIKNVLVPKNS